MMATFQCDILLTAFFFNNLTGTGRCNYIHSTYVAQHIKHQSDVLTLVRLCVCLTNVSASCRSTKGRPVTLDDVCADILPQAEIMTMFSEY